MTGIAFALAAGLGAPSIASEPEPLAAGAEMIAADGADSGTVDAAIIEAAESPALAAGGEVADPWEGFNRSMFSVHVFMDRNLLIPAAKGYRAVTPKKGRRGLRRFLANLRAPGIFVNDILQGEFSRAGETLGRFFINSTIGAGGFADPAAELGIAAHGEDFGQTLAVWGIDSGPFLFLPLIGPTTLRDGFGTGVQTGLDPLFYVRTPPADYARYSRAFAGGLSTREQVLDPLAEIEANSLDYYASFRSLYLQSRKREIANGRSDFSDLPDIGDFEDYEDEDVQPDDQQ